MTATEQITNFRIELQTAFLKMIMGRCVELSEQGKVHLNELCKLRKQELDKYFFITSINEDESITLEDLSKQKFERITLKHIEL